jgi:hypothetical protein
VDGPKDKQDMELFFTGTFTAVKFPLAGQMVSGVFWAIRKRLLLDMMAAVTLTICGEG